MTTSMTEAATTAGPNHLRFCTDHVAEYEDRGPGWCQHTEDLGFAEVLTSEDGISPAVLVADDNLTPAEARSLAAALTRGAEMVEDAGGGTLKIATALAAARSALGLGVADVAAAAGLPEDRVALLEGGTLATHAESSAIAQALIPGPSALRLTFGAPRA